MPKIKYKIKKDKTIKDILNQPVDKRKAGFVLKFIVLPVILVIIDQLTKLYISGNLEIGEEIKVIPGFFNIQYVVNKGAALGIFENMTGFLVIVSVVMILFIYWLAWSDYKIKRIILPEIIIIGGAFGNLIDRLFLAGKVRDFLEVPFFAVMNFADWFVSAGIILLVIKYIYYNRKSDDLESKQGENE